MRIEAAVWDDWRFEALAHACGYNLFEAVGRMARLWSACTDRETDTLPGPAVEVFLGPRGAEAIVSSDLGEAVEGGIRIRGSARFEWLWKVRRSARAGGESRRNAPRDAGRFVSEQTNTPALPPAPHQPDTSPTPPQLQPSVSVSVSGSVSSSPHKPPKGGTRKLKDITPEEHASAMRVLGSLSRYKGTTLSGRPSHLQLVAGRMRELAASGDTSPELTLRKVAWFCAVKLDWKAKPEMKPYLRPETLFGPQAIDRYIDDAVHAYRDKFGTDDDISKESA